MTHPTSSGHEPDTAPEQPDQPDDDASSDGDRSWTEDPITVDPDEDRSIEAVIARSAGSPGSHEDPA
jgi:hypothetical protein